MSMEAQFYEARRRQNFIDRRQSLQVHSELGKYAEISNHHMLHIPVRIIHDEPKREVNTCIPMRRNKITTSEQSVFQRHRDIYPRPPPLKTKFRRHVPNAVLHHRFSSTEYLQQW